MIRCLIIDDEPLSRQVLQSYAEDHPDLVVSGVCKDAMEAIKHLETEPVDLLLLDIHMPKLSGLSFYKSLQQKPQVVFTTAFSEHAVEGFELEATDYLLKPIAFDRFFQAIEKLRSVNGFSPICQQLGTDFSGLWKWNDKSSWTAIRTPKESVHDLYVQAEKKALIRALFFQCINII